MVPASLAAAACNTATGFKAGQATRTEVMNPHVPPEPNTHQEADLRFASSTQPDFQAAARHGARVRWIKRVLPIIVIVAALGIGANALISKGDPTNAQPVDIGRLTLAGTSLTMELPHLSGFTDDERGYSVTAQTAAQDLNQPDRLKLTDINARVALADNGWSTLEAKFGTVDIKSQVVYLSSNINVAMDGGYSGRLRIARIDVKKGELMSEKPVTFRYLDDAKLTADSLIVHDSGSRAIFTGNVQVDFVPSKLRQEAPVTTPAKPADKAPPPAPAAQPPAAQPEAKAPEPAPPAETAPPQTAAPSAASRAVAALARPDPVMADPAPADETLEGPVPTAVVPLPPRRPVIQADLLPPAYAPLPPRKPVPYP